MLVEDPSDALYGAALRGLFIVDPKGVVRAASANDENVGRSVSEVLRLVKAFQVRLFVFCCVFWGGRGALVGCRVIVCVRC